MWEKSSSNQGNIYKFFLRIAKENVFELCWSYRFYRSKPFSHQNLIVSCLKITPSGIFVIFHSVLIIYIIKCLFLQLQLIDKDPRKAIVLFWSAINAVDQLDRALKDMAIVMKQLDWSGEAIEAIKSFRHLCPYDSQEFLGNVLVELHKVKLKPVLSINSFLYFTCHSLSFPF